MIPATLKNRVFLIVTVVIFIILKIPHLHYAYYWDEGIPYAIGIKDLYHHGISLMPNAIDAEISRGHPLFFHAIAATWMHIFGDSHEAMHCFALTISILLLIAIYEAGLRLFNIRVAVIALLLVATQEMFFVQSSMVLFEVLVALLCFLSLIFYISERYVLSALCLAMLFYTKESGMIMGLVLGIDAIIHLFEKDAPWKDRLSRIAAVGIPTLLIGIYFIVQKQVQGWYIFPFYAGHVPHEWSVFWYSFRMASVRSEFYDYLKYWQFLLLAIVAIVAAIKQKNVRLLAILLPVICIYYFVDDMRAGRLLPPIPFFIVFALVSIFFLYQYSRPKLFFSSYQRRSIRLAGAFIFCFMCFSAMNFFTARYTIASIIPMFFITAVFLDKFITFTWKWLYYPILCGILTISVFAFKTNDAHGDCDLGAFDALTIQQKVVNYFEKNVSYDTHIACPEFLAMKNLSEPAMGFLATSKSFKHVQPGIDDSSQYLITDNIEGHWDDDLNKDRFRLIDKIDQGKLWAKIYKRQ